jgi:predicted metal-dependent peptidase
VTRALHAPGAAGRGIGAVLARALDLPRVETPWEVHLRRLLARAVSETPRLSHRRPRAGWIAAEAEARRSGGPAPVFEPGLARNRKRARIVVGLDSSGSVGDAVLSLFAAEVAGVARRSCAETHLLCFDDTVYQHAVLEPAQCESALTSVEFRREGGTSFENVMDEARRIEPSIAVILTDLDGPFGPRPPFDVVWATPNPVWPTPPFGKVLSLAR